MMIILRIIIITILIIITDYNHEDNYNTEVRVQFLELYTEDIQDFLCPKVNTDGPNLVI